MKNFRTAGLLLGLVLSYLLASVAVATTHKAPAGDYSQSDESVAVHAYIYADHTVIQMDSYQTALQIKDDSGGTIGYSRDGRFARLDGKLNHFTAYVDGAPVVFTRMGWNAPHMAKIAAVVPALGFNASGGADKPRAASAAGASEKAAAGPVASAPITASEAAALTKSARAAPPSLALSPQESLVATPKATAVPPQGAGGAVTPAAFNAAGVSPASAALAPGSAAAEPIAVHSIPPAPLWTLNFGAPIGQELKRWGATAGWRVIWNPPRDIVCPATASYSGDFQTAAGQVITDLAQDGALLHVVFYPANRAMVVSGPGVTPK